VNGNKILLDTNAFIYFFEGQSKVTNLIINTPEIYFSAISEIELLSASHLTKNDRDAIKAFLSLCQRVELSSEIINQTIEIRREYRFKIPDAVIAASALHLQMPLVSADTDFKKIAGLNLVSDILN
jgi:predicted nucleic acid-binding protein